MTPDRLSHWLRSAHRGSRLIYHVGNLYADRQASAVVETIAVIAMRASDARRASLVQRRIGDGVCEYIAVRR